MADAPGGGGFFTKKLGPFPTWVWIGLGVAVLYLYQSRKAAASSSTAQTDAATQALAQQGAAAAQYGYSGADLASMLSNLSGQVAMLGGGNTGSTGSTATSPGSTGTPAAPDYANEKLSGSGYYVPGSTVPIVGTNGHTYEWIASGNVIRSLPKGTIVYYQPTPGNFVSTGPVGQTKVGTGQGNVAPGTPTFLQVS